MWGQGPSGRLCLIQLGPVTLWNVTCGVEPAEQVAACQGDASLGLPPCALPTPTPSQAHSGKSCQ